MKVRHPVLKTFQAYTEQPDTTGQPDETDEAEDEEEQEGGE